jgi:VIT1/CCC1 family predicted Fe2+/Mn2+ transporter
MTMVFSRFHGEAHLSDRAAWLRAAILGADDGIVSTASLLIGVAAANASRDAVLVAGFAGLVAGAMSMAAGEYVSVSSQRDAELADIAKERRELEHQPEFELEELTQIYIGRGLEPGLARTVAQQLTRADPLGAHLRDELGMTEDTLARPLQAAGVSALSFALGAALPLAGMALAPMSARIVVVAVLSLLCMATLGAIGGVLGGADTRRAAIRVTVGGALAMAVTALIGRLAHTVGL